MVKSVYRIHLRQGEFELDVEGDKEFVSEYVAAFLAEEAAKPTAPAARQSAPKAKAAPGGLKKAAPEAEALSEKAPPALSFDRDALEDYVSQRKPETKKDRYLVYSGFLKSQGHKRVNDAMVRECYRAQDIECPTTGRQNFSLLRNDGLMSATKERGFWTLTPKGNEVLAGKPETEKKPKEAPAKTARRAPAAPKAPPRKAKAQAEKPKPAKARVEKPEAPKAQPKPEPVKAPAKAKAARPKAKVKPAQAAVEAVAAPAPRKAKAPKASRKPVEIPAPKAPEPEAPADKTSE